MLALVFGYFAFRSRIKGVYLSIVTQALTYAAMLLFFQNATGFGGNNGLTDFKRIVGFPLQAPSTKLALYVISAARCCWSTSAAASSSPASSGACWRAIRDAELKTRFCGFESTNYKLFVWTLSAMMCALAGALYVPQVGIINPSEMQPSNSIEMAIWVAVGGRGTLVGALLGRLVHQRRQELAHGGVPVGLAVRAGRAVRGRDAVSAQGAGRIVASWRAARRGGAARAAEPATSTAGQVSAGKHGAGGDRRRCGRRRGGASRRGTGRCARQWPTQCAPCVSDDRDRNRTRR